MQAVILVEGASDQRAVEAPAVRRGRDLAAERVTVMPIGGAGNIRRALTEVVARQVTALCDIAQAADFRLAFADAGLEPAHVHACDADLEDELIRCLGAARPTEIVEAAGELGRLRTFQNQPFQRTRPLEAQLRRFLGTRGGRQIQYAPRLVGALDLAHVPRPLDGVLASP